MAISKSNHRKIRLNPDEENQNSKKGNEIRSVYQEMGEVKDGPSGAGGAAEKGEDDEP